MAWENGSRYGEPASGPRFYAYVLNDPLNLVDPLGLSPDERGSGNYGLSGTGNPYGPLSNQGVQVACLEDACIGEAAIAAMVLGTGAAITAQQNQQVIPHGNSLDSQRQTYVYQLVNPAGDILKYGITSQPNPTDRYTTTEYAKNNAQMQVITSYSNRGFARAHELALTYGYYLQNGAYPPLTGAP